MIYICVTDMGSYTWKQNTMEKIDRKRKRTGRVKGIEYR
jgi:hypothetical protein